MVSCRIVSFVFLLGSAMVVRAEIPTQLGPNGHRIPATLPHMYEHAFRIQNSMEKQADREERNGRPGSAFRNILRLRFQLPPEQFLSFETSAQRFADAERRIQAQMFAVIAAEKTAHRVKVNFATSTPSKSAIDSMHELIAERDGISAGEIEVLHQALGPKTAQRLDAAVVNLYNEAQQTSPNVLHPDVYGPCPTDPSCIYYDDVPGPPDTDDGGGASDPPPTCFAQLKYRSVPVMGIDTSYNHSFWWIQDSNETQWVTDAGPTGNCLPSCGFLNDWVVQGTVGHYPQDNAGAAVAWTSGTQSGPVCSQVDDLYDFAITWPNNSTSYAVGRAPNSNTFAHEAATAGGFNPAAPPNAPGW
jgi:hypothetical protein